MNKKTVALISLGCEKNLVDSEMILGLAKKGQLEIISDISIADIIIVNTCGFIVSAKEEAINTILDVIDDKKRDAKVLVCGCLVQRYLDDLKIAIPDVDMWIPIRDYYKFGDMLKTLINDYNFNSSLDMHERVISTPSHLAYVRIGDGCNNRCTYCAIPLIRGNYNSRTIADIKSEVIKHVKDGRSEICLISQDLTTYGVDINCNLVDLLKELVTIEGIKYIRMLYLYPDEISEDLIEFVRDNKVIMPYFDIPMQHASNKILKYMHRRGTKEDAIKLINHIRELIPTSIIRTTMMVGFPYETEKDFNELLDFIEEVKFNHLGAFAYSREEDTISYDYKSQVPSKLKQERLNKLMDKQRWISLDLNKKFIGNTYECIIESYNEEEDLYYGRTYAFAPDDIDGEVIINAMGKKLEISKIYNVKVTDVDFYDIKAEII